MSALQTHLKEKTQLDDDRGVNNFSITVATINGSGSQTSNLTMLRALFKMGIPVSGKNLFPSNIQGLPTWYTIRVSKDGFLARREEHEIVVAMNPATFIEDLAGVQPGGAFFYADDIRYPINRDDVIAYPMPVKQIAKNSDAPSNLRDYVANMVYVGVLAQNLGIDLDKIYQALNFHFKGKTKPIDLNFGVVRASAEWAAKPEVEDTTMHATQQLAQQGVRVPVARQTSPGTLSAAEMRKMVQIFESMDAENAARILLKMDDFAIRQVIAVMKKRQSAKILAVLEPERAARIRNGKIEQ